MDGTVSTPFGHMKKQTAYIAGGGILIMGILFYRSKKAAQQSAAIASAGAANGIDPATGYTYGSAEDASALANQSAYQSGTSYGGGGGPAPSPSYSGSTPGTFVSNAQWAQYVEQYMTSNGNVSDATALSAAVGKYLTGQPINDPNQVSLVQQAIAVGGQPPVAGGAGFPPNINTNPAGNTMPEPTLANHPAQVYHPPAVMNGEYAAVAVGAEWWTNTFADIARAYGWSDASKIMSDSRNAQLVKQVGGSATAKLPQGATVYAWYNPNHQESSNIWASIPAPNPNWPN